jgi:hypothetical protein
LHLVEMVELDYVQPSRGQECFMRGALAVVGTLVVLVEKLAV